MAKVFLARDGSGPNKSDDGRYLSSAQLRALTEGRRLRRLADKDVVINGDTAANWVAAYRYVILVLDDDDVRPPGLSAGNYLVEDMDPAACEALLATGS